MRRVTFLLALGALSLASCQGGHDTPDPHPFSESVAAELSSIRETVMDLRGLPAHPSVTEGWLARDEWVAWLDEGRRQLTEEDREKLETYSAAWRLLRLIEPGIDVFDEFVEGQATSTAGLYFFEDDALVLLGEPDSLSLSDRGVLAHEYVHSLQDGSFDIDANDDLMEAEHEHERATEYSVTLGCVREGDATLAQIQYLELTAGPDWRTQLQADELDSPDVEAEVDDTPPAIERYATFDYRECYQFVHSVYEDGGWDAVNELYERPPLTSEQVLHPGKYQSGEGPLDLQVLDLTGGLGGSWELLDVGTFGEFDVLNHLLTVGTDPARVEFVLHRLNELAADPATSAADATALRAVTAGRVELQVQSVATAAAAGWGAGWAAVYYRADDTTDGGEDRTLVHISLVWDSERDLDEYLFAMGHLLPYLGDEELIVEDDQAQWQSANESGFLTWDYDQARSELLISISRSATKVASIELARQTGMPGMRDAFAAATPLPSASELEAAWANSGFARRCTGPGPLICLVPYGATPDVDLRALAAHFERTLDVAVEIAPMLPIAPSVHGHESLITSRGQLSGGVAADQLRLEFGARPAGVTVIAITPYDMYSGNDILRGVEEPWEFVFNVRTANISIVSTARMNERAYALPDDPELLFDRVRKTVARNIGLLHYQLAYSDSPGSPVFHTVLSLGVLDSLDDSRLPALVARTR